MQNVKHTPIDLKQYLDINIENMKKMIIVTGIKKDNSLENHFYKGAEWILNDLLRLYFK